VVDNGAHSACTAPFRLRTWKLTSAFTSVLFRLDRKQTSPSFHDDAKEVRFKDRVNQIGLGKVPKVIVATESSVSRCPATGFTGSSRGGRPPGVDGSGGTNGLRPRAFAEARTTTRRPSGS